MSLTQATARDRKGIKGESLHCALHCALLLDYVPPEEPPSKPLGNAQKRAEMLRHPCILGGPQTKGDKIRSQNLR